MRTPLRAQASTKSPSRATAGSLHGQAALEYLVTYGWALLALMFVVAFLISTGAFSAGNFASQECTFQPGLPCSPYILYKQDGTHTVLSFNLTNGLGFPINVTDVSYVATDLGTAGRQQYDDGLFPAKVIKSGEKFGFSYTFDGSRQPSPRDIRTILVGITYQNCRFSPCAGSYNTSGRVTAVAEGTEAGSPPAGPDFSPPTISQSVSVAGGGVVTITSSATDASGIASMRIYTASGVPAGHGSFVLGKTCGSSPCIYTTGLNSGSYVYYVSATDASTNSNLADSAVEAFVIP